MKKTPESFDVIVLGAGGAGLMCAAVAGQRGKRVIVVDHNTEPGRKILISGGGRCNFTNIDTSADNFLSDNPHFPKSALSRYQPQDFIGLVERHGIAWHEKTLGQFFCDGSAKQIVQMLLDECRKGRVELMMGIEVQNVTLCENLYVLDAGDRAYEAPALVVATGGLSIPKLGATGFAYQLARQFGLSVIEPRPALVPFTLGADEALFRDLAGVATDTKVACGEMSFREASLFTHKGLSGPAMLQISSYWQHGESILVDFFPDADAGWLLEQKQAAPAKTFGALVREHLPKRLADALSSDVLSKKSLGSLKDSVLRSQEEVFANWQFRPSGTEGFAKAEVTIGGVSTAELSSRTMEATKQTGLYFIGEAVDVTGWLGGYNFQWAWASGAAAGNAL